jgi:FkbM family methyltransferase
MHIKQVSRHALQRAKNIILPSYNEGIYRMHGLLADTVTLSTKQGLLTMSTHDRVITRSMFHYKQFEYDSSCKAIDFLKRMNFIPDDDILLLDIGANIGMIGIGLLLSDKVSRVIAIEPEPKNFDHLTRNVEQNRLTSQMICLPLAIGDTETTLTMELSPDNLGDHRVRSTQITATGEKYNESQRQTIQVKSVPLPDILDLDEVKNTLMNKPSMVWIDVQGYEGYVFKGAQDFLSTGIPTVSEIWPYGILRSGMNLEQFATLVQSIWSDYWVERRGRFIRYPIAVFDRYLDEIGSENHHENVIFT